MPTLSSDTYPCLELAPTPFWQHASPTQKMQAVAVLNAAGRELALLELRARYPQANAAELRRRLADWLLGEELAQKVYGALDAAK